MAEKLKVVGMGSVSHEGAHMACSRYWLLMFELASKILGDYR